jgi:acetyl esterase/lipase
VNGASRYRIDSLSPPVIFKRMINRLLLFCFVLPFWASADQTNNNFTRTEDVIYGRKSGTALTLDVFTPAVTNGAGILWLVSSGYGSAHEAINPKYFRTLLARGYTVFVVVHGSAPKFSVPEIEPDILRAARFVRHHAADYGVNPQRFGAIGASAGGHLALTLVTKGVTGDASSTDPVARESSAVQCAVAFFPPTDYLNYGAPGREAAWIEPLLGLNTNGVPAAVAAEGTRLRREISVLYFVHSNQPPVLIFQGDKDYMVPVGQAQSFVKRSEELGNTAKLIIKPGAGHGWPDMTNDMVTAADWFDEHLRVIKSDGKNNLGGHLGQHGIIGYKTRFHHGNHFETVPSASSGGKTILWKPFSQ